MCMNINCLAAFNALRLFLVLCADRHIIYLGYVFVLLVRGIAIKEGDISVRRSLTIFR